MRENSRENFRIVVDTNILFSAIRYRGEAFKLLNKAEKAGCSVMIPKYSYLVDGLVKILVTLTNSS